MKKLIIKSLLFCLKKHNYKGDQNYKIDLLTKKKKPLTKQFLFEKSYFFPRVAISLINSRLKIDGFQVELEDCKPTLPVTIEELIKTKDETKDEVV